MPREAGGRRRRLASRAAPAVWLCATAVSPALRGQEVPVRLQSIDAYLLDEAAEVALARSAAPERIAADAAVLVLHADGYREARAGRNGFTCLVERSWSSPIGMHRDFFNPRLRAPICYNQEAGRTILRDYLMRTDLALGGATIAEIQRTVASAIGTGELRPPVGVAMSFMLSPDQLLGTEAGRFVPHVMFYIPYATNGALGHDPGADCHACLFEHAGGPLAALVVPVGRFEAAEEPR